jgi:hypothetical protein
MVLCEIILFTFHAEAVPDHVIAAGYSYSHIGLPGLFGAVGAG